MTSAPGDTPATLPGAEIAADPLDVDVIVRPTREHAHLMFVLSPPSPCRAMGSTPYGVIPPLYRSLRSVSCAGTECDRLRDHHACSR
jgi:hypothetical protein